jgi:hypothetical protein
MKYDGEPDRRKRADDIMDQSIKAAEEIANMMIHRRSPIFIAEVLWETAKACRDVSYEPGSRELLWHGLASLISGCARECMLKTNTEMER